MYFLQIFFSLNFKFVIPNTQPIIQTNSSIIACSDELIQLNDIKLLKAKKRKKKKEKGKNKIYLIFLQTTRIQNWKTKMNCEKIAFIMSLQSNHGIAHAISKELLYHQQLNTWHSVSVNTLLPPHLRFFTLKSHQHIKH